MPEPSEKDYTHADYRKADDVIGKCACACTVCDVEVLAIARALSAAREEGRRQGLEEAAAHFDKVAEMHRAKADEERRYDASWFSDEQREQAEDVARAIRALIGGPPAPCKRCGGSGKVGLCSPGHCADSRVMRPCPTCASQENP